MIRILTFTLLTLIFVACDDDNPTDGDADGDTDGDSDCDCEPGSNDCCCNNDDCSDGIYCNGVEICDRGRCERDPNASLDPVSGTYQLVCDDGRSCTHDQCNELANLCEYIPNHEACDNDNICDGIERCEPANSDADEGGCVAGSPVVCDDGDDCTTDYCEENECRVRVRDGDGDGHPDRNCQACTDPEDPDTCIRGDDCDDNDRYIYPGAEEICDDGKDNNCDHDRDYADPDCDVPNDECAEALELSDEVPIHNSTRGTRANIEESCGSASNRDVVFYFNLAVQSDIEIEIESSSSQNVYLTLTPDCDNGDETILCETGRTFSTVRRALDVGTYYIVVSSPNEVDFSIELNAEPVVPGPDGDFCPTAPEFVADGTATTITTTDARHDFNISCVDEDDTELLDVVYWFEVPTEQTADFSIELPSGTGIVALAVQNVCGLSTSEMACWTGEDSAEGRIWVMRPGTYYLIAAHEAEAELQVTATLSTVDPGLYYVEDFESEPSGWTLNGAWSQGIPSGSGGEPAPDVGGCIAASLGGTYPPSMSFTTDYAQSPAIDLRSSTAPELRFRAWLQTTTWSAGGHVSIATDPAGPYTVISGTPGYDSVLGGSYVWVGDRVSWEDYTIPLADYAGSIIYLRFAMYSDRWDHSPRQGWYVDQLMVLEP